MESIPNIPLRLPLMQNISREPSYPYQFQTKGMILSKQFNQLLEIISTYWTDFDQLQNQLKEHFSSHFIYEMLETDKINQIGDFCRHVLHANKDGIGWDIVDIELNKLDNIVIPSWRLPNFDFIEHFDHILTRIVKVYFSDRLIEEIKRIFQSNVLAELQLDKDVKTHLNLWSIKELWLLLSYLGSDASTEELVDEDSHKQLLNIIINTFEEIIYSGSYPIHEQICLIILYIDGYATLSKNAALKSKELVDKIWMDIKELPYQEKLSYKYLMGAAYSLIGDQIFRQNTDFVTRKLFVDSIIQNYIEVEEYKLQNWFTDLLSQNINELIMDLLIRGYSKTVPLLQKHAIELPDSKTKSDLISTITYMTNMLKLVGLIFLAPPKNITDDAIADLLTRIEEQFSFTKVKHNMLELLYSISIQSIFLETSEETISSTQYHEFVSSVFRQSFNPARLTIYNLDYNLNNNLFPYLYIFDKIKQEVTDKGSLILSATFEEQLISKVSYCMQSFIDLKTSEDLFITVYEVLTQYILSWLNLFYEEEDLFHEALMVLSPLIHICLVQQTRYYFENNFPKKAFLANLNLHSFMEIYSDEIDKAISMEFRSIKLSEKKKIESRYRELTKNWQMDILLEPTKIKELIIETRHQFKESGLKSSGYTGSLVEDAIISGYLDEIEKLEQFMQLNYLTSENTIAKQLIENNFHSPYKSDSIYRLERIGLDTISSSLPIPLFNNLHKLSVATDLFEIKAKVETVIERNVEIQKRYEEVQISPE